MRLHFKQLLLLLMFIVPFFHILQHGFVHPVMAQLIETIPF